MNDWINKMATVHMATSPAGKLPVIQPKKYNQGNENITRESSNANDGKTKTSNKEYYNDTVSGNNDIIGYLISVQLKLVKTKISTLF